MDDDDVLTLFFTLMFYYPRAAAFIYCIALYVHRYIDTESNAR